MDFNVNGIEVGEKNSEVNLRGGGAAHVTVKAVAYLETLPAATARHRDEENPPKWAVNSASFDKGDPFLVTPQDALAERPYAEKPYWHIERARIGTSREVPVELIVDGEPVARKTILADGVVRDLSFDTRIARSSWIAARILPSSHTNPVFVIVDGKPIRASRRSAEWCLAAVNQCWTQKAPKISKAEVPEAQQAYDHARDTYKKLLEECR